MLDQTSLVHAREILAAVPAETSAATWLYERWFHQMDGRTHYYPRAAEFQIICADALQFSKGWSVSRRGVYGLAAAVEVTDGVLRRIVAPPNLYPEDPATLTIVPGTRVRVNPIACGHSDGFYHFHSLQWQCEGMPRSRKRLYFSVKKGSELHFVKQYLRHAIPEACWSLKTLCDEAPAGRRDVAVMYISQNEPVDQGWIANLISAVSEHLHASKVPITQVVANGVSLAPDQSEKRSFGQLLCDAIAEVYEVINVNDGQLLWLDRVSQRLQDMQLLKTPL